jgi:hypothetical protein
MTAQNAIDGKLGVNVTQVDDVAAATAPLNFPKGQQPLGTRTFTANGGVWIYVSLPAIVQAGSAVVIDPAAAVPFTANLATTANSPFGQLVGIAPAVASLGNYGWVQLAGVIDNVYVGASCAANVRLNTTATGGMLDDDGTALSKSILGITITSARAASNGVAPGAGVGGSVGVTL